MDPALREYSLQCARKYIIKIVYFVYSEEKGITSSRRREDIENFEKRTMFSLDLER